MPHNTNILGMLWCVPHCMLIVWHCRAVLSCASVLSCAVPCCAVLNQKWTCSCITELVQHGATCSQVHCDMTVVVPAIFLPPHSRTRSMPLLSNSPKGYHNPFKGIGNTKPGGR
jgi:hypothetical protein